MVDMVIALIALSVFSVTFLIAYIDIAKKMKIISLGFTELFLSYNALKDATENYNETENTSEEIHQQSFIKFLSDSRDWAFTYIEDVQSGLQKFVNDVDSHISYFDEYGSVLSEGRPDFLAMTQISKSYKELKKLLTEESKK